MKIKWRIISVDEGNHSFIIRYYDDVLTEEILRNSSENTNGYPTLCRTDVNITVWDLNTSKEDLIKRIEGSAPVDWFKMQHRIMQNEKSEILKHVKTIVGKEHEFEHKEHVINVIKEPLSDEEIDKLLENLSKKK